MTSAIVVGAGPNGLAAAITLAQRGIVVTVQEAAETIGGGARSSERILPGLMHDDGAAVHPIGLASPFFQSLGLADHGLEWGWPEIDLAHPLPDGRAGAMMNSLNETSRFLGVDGRRWRSLFGPLAENFDDLAQEVLGPLLHVPRHLGPLARFGPAALLPATVLGRVWHTNEAAALFAGNAALAGDALPSRVRKAYRRFRRAPAAVKLDLAVDGGTPWRDVFSGRAGTVHVCGSAAEVVASEAEIHRGRMPERLFVLVAQQYLADPAWSVGDVHPVYVYAHVPHGYSGDATNAVLAQLERFAPGTRDRIVGSVVRTPADLGASNANLVGGDIIGGANDPLQVVMRPRIAADPYATGIPGVYICSASTPPGAGVHGMCGHNAALSALRRLGL